MLPAEAFAGCVTDFAIGESKKTVKRYLDTHPRNCRIMLMEDTNLAAMYAATVYPIYVVVDRDGYIVATQRGAGGERALRRNLARAGISAPDEDASLVPSIVEQTR